jgi:DivIVA domain-containing protein
LQLDRQSIEKRDFPIARRGYDPAAVDAHLRTLASEVQELMRVAADRGGHSLASSAGSQVKSILEAAEATAADIERQATEDAYAVREQANGDAARTREQAIAQAQAHVQAVSQSTAVLIARVESMDGETGALVERLRGGTDRLSSDLDSIEANMRALYDAASGQASHTSAAAPPQPHRTPIIDQLSHEEALPQAGEESFEPEEEIAQTAESADLDGARLVALNMALNGETREDTEHYLLQNFQLPDRAKLLDEVYAAIEG